jgi:hypothetical protein
MSVVMATPLCLPREIDVRVNGRGEPVAVTRNGRRNRVAAIQGTWRIDDEWWRETISRQYFQVELQGGLVLTIFRDLVSGRWYQQRY